MKLKSRKSFLKIIKRNQSDLNRLVNNIDKYYYQKTEEKKKPNKDGSPRLRYLYPSKGELKYVQRLIKNRILSRIVLPNCVFGGVKKRDNIKNAKQHKGKKNKFLTDLKDFFPSIKPFHVYDALIKEGFSPDVASLITRLTTYKNQIPQGAPTSTHISNIVFKSIDMRVKEICSNKNITYTRFVDDLSFSSSTSFKSEVAEILDCIYQNRFSISHKKTYYTIGSAEITGVRTRNNSLDVSDKMRDKLANMDEYTEFQHEANFCYAQRVWTS